jgi:hemoglobin
MRHLPFAIGTNEAEEWLRCMRGALADIAVMEPLRTYLDTRLSQTANHVVNS